MKKRVLCLIMIMLACVFVFANGNAETAKNTILTVWDRNPEMEGGGEFV